MKINVRSMVALGLASCLIAASCGSDSESGSDPSTGPSPTAEEETTSSAPTSETPTSETPTSETPTPDLDFDPDATLRVGANFPGIAFFDPINENTQPVNENWMNLIYGSMTRRIDFENTAPGLATEWEAIDDYQLRLKLVEDHTFSDGTPFNADAVKFSWERAAEAANQQEIFLALDHVEVLDEYELIVHLNQPYVGGWIERLLPAAVSGMAVVSPTAVEELGDEGFSDAPVGAGPYVLTSFEPDQRIALTRRDDFFDPSMQMSAEVEFIQIAPGPTQIAALQSGQVDVIGLSNTLFADAESVGLDTYLFPPTITRYVALCRSKAPFDNVDARRAIAHAIDREDLVSTLYGDLGEPIATLWPESSPLYSDADVELMEYNPDEAVRLAEETGLIGASLDLMVLPSPAEGAMAEVIALQLKELLDIDVTIIPSPNFFADLRAEQPQMHIIAFHSGSIGNSVSPGQVANPCDNDDPATLEALAGTMLGDADTRAQAWEDLQVAIAADLPFATFATGYGLVAAAPDRIVGPPFSVIQGIVDVTQIGVAL